MSWDKQTSLDRIQKRWDARDKEITVTKLTREMNLENVTLHNGRLIVGAHVYATIGGTGRLTFWTAPGMLRVHFNAWPFGSPKSAGSPSRSMCR